MSKPTLSTATQEEIQAAHRKTQEELKFLPCTLCETPFKQRRLWQKFCSTSCRVKYYQLKKAIEEQRMSNPDG